MMGDGQDQYTQGLDYVGCQASRLPARPGIAAIVRSTWQIDLALWWQYSVVLAQPNVVKPRGT
jgi:hypothetical protein